jgi:hypothetical protein
MESKSIKRFKDDLVKVLPFFPNNKETKEELLSQSISSILFHYIHWAARFIPLRPRKIIIDPYMTGDSRWKTLKPKVEKLLDKVRNGEDLSPYLSSKAHAKGYTPSERIKNGEVDSWEDKDRVLNTMGFHHLHLGETITDGLAERTNEVIFVRVSREDFHAIAIFDHAVFDDSRDANDQMNSERSRLWNISQELSARGMPAGSVYVSNPITTSGHPLHIHDITFQYTHVIDQLDHKLSDNDFHNSIYNETGLTKPKNNKLRWYINGLDLGLIDKEDQFFILRHGYS